MFWIWDRQNSLSASELSQDLGISEILAQLLTQRGIDTAEAGKAYLYPRLASLDDPFNITNLRAVVDRICQALQLGEKITIFGDYDVDGVTSTALLLDILRRFGNDPSFTVPKRMEEGYGLSRVALERALEDGQPNLFIAVDCGTSSKAEVAWLRERNIDVIIIDHHTSKESLPEDCLLINPHVNDPENVPWKNFCAVGLVFKVVHGLLKKLREDGDSVAIDIPIKDYLDIVAMGTVADLVPLIDENRLLTQHGLKQLKTPRRTGLYALFEVAGLGFGTAISPFDIAFKLSPRINASGRLDDASKPIELLLSENLTDCRAIARELDQLNRDRQEIEAGIAEQAIQQVEENYADDAGLVLYNPEWHSGVVGIVASRMVQQFHRPTIVLGADGDLAKGSGRSISEVDLVRILSHCESNLHKWGGHPMAVGLTINPDQIDAFRQNFSDAIIESINGDAPTKSITISNTLSANDLNEKLLSQLELLEPYGQENPQPVFALLNQRIERIQTFGKGHLRFSIPRNGNLPISAVAWKAAENTPPENIPLDLAFRFHWNIWNGRKDERITLVDWRISE